MAKKKKALKKDELGNDIYTIETLKSFIAAVEKKFGEKALKFRVEMHHAKTFSTDEVFMVPEPVGFLGIATYPKDEENPKETVMVIK